eukprot:scpid14028/ scgid35102/ 
MPGTSNWWSMFEAVHTFSCRTVVLLVSIHQPEHAAFNGVASLHTMRFLACSCGPTKRADLTRTRARARSHYNMVFAGGGLGSVDLFYATPLLPARQLPLCPLELD